MAKHNGLTLSVDETHVYWREYHGEIPVDAIKGGHNAKATTTYIGRAVAKLEHDSYGMYPGSIVRGQSNIEIAVDHIIQSSDLSVSILCSNMPNKFHWSKTSSWTFRDMFTASRYPVRGGLQKDASKQTPLYIGRYKNGHEIVVGKIPFAIEDTDYPLYYPSAQGELKTDHYEVLLVEP